MEFVVLPDDARAGEQVDAGDQVLRHTSGRPWVAGRWHDDEVTVAAAGRRRLLVAGIGRPGAETAARLVERVSGLHDLDAVAAKQPGSLHWCLAVDGGVRMQGTLTGSRQVFHTTARGVTYAATSARLLAERCGRDLDRAAIALRLIMPQAPFPLSDRPVWVEVTPLPVGTWLELTPSGGHRVHRWWAPPEPELPASRAVAEIREALCEAVGLRARLGTISSDLSGGLDSTILCFLAAGSGAELITNHWLPRDPGNDDAIWAARAAAALPKAQHHRVAPDEVPSWYSEATMPGAGPDGPLAWYRNQALMTVLSHRMRGEASRAHMMGVGGDELFSLAPAHFWSLVRRRPLRGLRAAHRARLLNRWKLLPTVAALTDPRSPGAELRALARVITSPEAAPDRPPSGWNGAVRLPPWVTPDAAEVVRQQLATAAAEAAPLHRDRTQHQVTDMVTRSGNALREVNAVLSEIGLPWEAPMLDDRVVTAALRVRLADRVVAGRYKPVLTTAVRGLVPDSLLSRGSKGDFSAEAYHGLRSVQPRLAAWSEDLCLSRLGLVDGEALRQALTAPMPHMNHVSRFENTLAVESWLRAATAPAKARGGTDGVASAV
jgi:asparagine synthase (glutamine-hydrolysing)